MKPIYSLIAAIVVLVVGALAPVLFGGQPYVLYVLTLALCYAIPAIGMNLLYGYTGLVSLGHMGFAGVGAYTTAVLMKDYGVPFVPSLLAGAVAAGGIGLLVGIPCLRLRSHFFIVVTLAVGMILYTLFNNLDGLTGGAEGLPGIPRPQNIEIGSLVIEFRSLGGFYMLTFVITALIFGLQYLLVRSDFGRSLSSVRQDEALAAARGVDVFAHKLFAFVLSAAIAGVGGAMKVLFLRAAAPLSFELQESINLMMMLILGGAGFLVGPIIGAITFVALPEFLRVANQLRLIFFGFVLLALARFAPRGICGLVEAAYRKLSNREKAVVAHP
ncbi:branched-chain amino acid ABC transporter permease [Mesorhizobium sp. CAU 1732]|uniref:branched-chain amino acid ABC transporter permease n=1 Tax=Mesorhizobium sp. CAU 1732 TaxID=3140358 RepID=UPI0032604F2A